MTIYRIGRDPNECDIVVNESCGMVSRVHAVLVIDDKGHYGIIDQSTNGTYVNGIRINPGERCEVRRGDSISFAHEAELDWNLIAFAKKSSKRIVMIAAGCVAAVALIAGALFLVLGDRSSGAVSPGTYYAGDSSSSQPVTKTRKSNQEISDGTADKDQQSRWSKGMKNNQASETNSSSSSKASENSVQESIAADNSAAEAANGAASGVDANAGAQETQGAANAVESAASSTDKSASTDKVNPDKANTDNTSKIPTDTTKKEKDKGFIY